MALRIAIRNLMAVVALLILVGCTTAAQGVGVGETPIAPTPTTTGTITPLLGSPPAPTSASSPTAAPGGVAFARTITNADAGGTVQIKVGDRIAVALQAPAGSDPWEVALPDPQMLMPVPNPAAAAVQGATLRAFLAVGPGQTAITAQDRIHCNPGQGACAGAIRAFRVTVVVAP